MDKSLIPLLIFMGTVVKRISSRMDLISKMVTKSFIKQGYYQKYSTQNHHISNITHVRSNSSNIK